ncbi:MAG TPA: 3D domain-containing protein [Candidatus Hydromicrobium sp.]
MKKYNIAKHILFWILVVFLLSIVAFSLSSENDKIGSLLPFLKSAELPEKENVAVREVKEVEKKVDWYFFVASGYSANDPAQGTDNVTATGKEIRKGMIAVDPDVIPLGTRIEIKNMGFFTAEDTGGKIKGNRIDIYFDSKKEAEEFGKKGVWVQIINNNYKLELADL